MQIVDGYSGTRVLQGGAVPLTAVAAAFQGKPRLEARFVSAESELRAAQRLRADVFGAEFGVVFDDPEGLDRDGFDSYCEHLNVHDRVHGRVVATTRLLTRESARLAGSFYSAQEFDLAALAGLPGRVLEIGRTCVHPDYRSGAAIAVLWSALADYLCRQDFSYLLGCASISLRDGGHNFAALMPELRERHLVDPALRVVPRRPVLLGDLAAGTPASLPSLLKAYLRMGGRIGGEACWDPQFHCADVFVLLDVAAMSGRYAQRFLKAG